MMVARMMLEDDDGLKMMVNGGDDDWVEMMVGLNALSLKEREGPVRTLKTNLKVAGLWRMATSLVRNVLSTKAVNRDGFRAIMRKIWQTREGVEIDPVIRNIFAFQFGNMEDKQRIVSEGQWSLNDALIFLEEKEGKGDIQRMKSLIFKDCYDKPKDLEAANGEEFLFGFWMRASAPSRGSRNGGRKWLLDERGEGLPFKERGNWRSLNRAEAGRDGDRREFPMANGDGSLQQNPRLESG
ncbi:hypothetical protein LWI28_028747 [Acer negundo]|uniref:DUF4283 domain-containing protein n=1 Tax=Acer negundo TaxID=4023 RepID=A0AAD5NZK7_ACENE|nr:hypothetical protein LWI28_028747 [Acer negundo]